MKSLRKIALAAWLVLAPAALVSADTVWVGTGPNPIKIDGVKITAVTGDKLAFTTANGTENKKPLAQVQQIAVDGETAFDAAEQAFRDSKWPDAVDGYQHAIQSTSKDWIKARSTLRLVEAAAKTNRFDAAATAYVSLVQMNPEAAAKAKPAMPDAGSQYLDPAAATVNKALDITTLSATQRSALLGFLLDIYRTKKDTANSNRVLDLLVKAGGASPADMAVLKLATARVAVDSKNYQKAIDDIQQNRGLFTDSGQQVDALFTLAQAQDGLTGDKDDANAQKDIALAYMRVVTFGKELPGQPHVADSLLRVAQIEEKLKEPQVALQMYRQIAKDYADQPAAADAKTSIGRLGKGT